MCVLRCDRGTVALENRFVAHGRRDGVVVGETVVVTRVLIETGPGCQRL